MSVVLLLMILSFAPVRENVEAQTVSYRSTLVYGLPYTFTEHSYYQSNSYSTRQWNQAVYAGLYARQSALNRLFGPDLAAAMPTVSSDGIKWTIDLKSGLVFDNGNPITADDVVFSYQVALTPSINSNTYSELIPWFASNDSIEAVDSDTVKFTLSDTYAFTLSLLTNAIIDKSVWYDRYDNCLAGNTTACAWNAEDGSDTLSTTGPYSVDSIDTKNNIVTVTKNFNYWNEENVWADTLVFIYIETKEAALSELTAGNIDIMDSQYTPLPQDFTGLTGVEFASVSSPSHQEISVNHLNPYFGTGKDIPGNGGVINATSYEDARLMRDALSHIVNREFLVNEILDGLGQAAATVMPSASIGWDSSVTPDPYDVIFARQIMEVAGWNYSTLPAFNSTFEFNDPDAVCGVTGDTDECFFEITVLSPNTNPARNQWAALYVTELPKIGIGVKEHASVNDSLFKSRTIDYPLNTLVPEYDLGGFDVAFTGYPWALDWNPSGKYTNSGLCNIGDCKNYYNFVNTTIESQINDYLSDVNVTSRNEKVADLQTMLTHENPVIPLIYPQETWAWAGDVLGLDLLLISGANQEWGRVRSHPWFPPPPPPQHTPTTRTTSENNDTSIQHFPVLGLVAILVVSVVFTSLSRRKL